MKTGRSQLLCIGAPLAACLLTLIFTQMSNRVDAQAGCTNCLPSTATRGQQWTWAQNTTVTVNISPMFNAAQGEVLNKRSGTGRTIKEMPV